jgi:hypothetical protein
VGKRRDGAHDGRGAIYQVATAQDLPCSHHCRRHTQLTDVQSRQDIPDGRDNAELSKVRSDRMPTKHGGSFSKNARTW